MGLRFHWAGGVLGTVAAVWTAAGAVAEEPAYFVEEFEGRWPVFRLGAADGAVSVEHHDLSDESVHGGRKSERIAYTVAGGTRVPFVMEIGRAALIDELTLSVWVRASRPGVRLLARVVFPRETDPATGQARYALLVGDSYSRPGHWQHLTLADAARQVTRRQTAFRMELGVRDFDVREAYIDQVVLDGFCGVGPAVLYVDDVRVGPFVGSATRPSVEVLSRPWGTERRQVVAFRSGRLTVDQVPFFPLGIQWQSLDLERLKALGVNTVEVDFRTDKAFLQQAADQGLWLAPRLDSAPAPDGPEVAQFPFLNAVLYWVLGRGADVRQADRLGALAQAVRLADPNKDRPAALLAEAGFDRLGRVSPMIGAAVNPLATPMTFAQMAIDLQAMHLLCRPGNCFWTYVASGPDEWQWRLGYGLDPSRPPAEPIGPDGEQLELMAYYALLAEARALVFTDDRYFQPAYFGLDRLAAAALVALHLELVGPMLAGGTRPEIVPGEIGSTAGLEERSGVRGIQAGVLRYREATLLVCCLDERYSQYAVSGARDFNVRVTVPGVPQAAEAWEITFEGLRALRPRRDLRGTTVTLPTFDLTAMVLLTTQPDLVESLRQEIERRQPRAAELAIAWLEAKYQKVKAVHLRLQALRHDLPDIGAWLLEAWNQLEKAKDRVRERRYGLAYQEARLGLVALRRLQRAYWEDAVVRTGRPAASPYALSFYTTPQQHELADRIRRAIWSDNLLVYGDFESPRALPGAGNPPGEPSSDRSARAWTVHVRPELPGRAEVVRLSLDQPEVARQGRGFLYLEVEPVLNPADQAAQALQAASRPSDGSLAAPDQVLKPGQFLLGRDIEHVRLESHALPVQRGDLIRVSAYVQVPRTRPDWPGANPAPDFQPGLAWTHRGVVVSTSLGGPALEFGFVQPTPGWELVQFYREVVVDPGQEPVRVHLGLCGAGVAYIDHVQVQKVVALRPERKEVQAGQ